MGAYFFKKKRRFQHALIKTITIWFLFFECLVPYFKTNNFNDDIQERPLFHGAYAVSSFIENDLPIPPLTIFSKRWKRVFVHRRGYIIVQTMDDKMQDYEFLYDLESQIFSLKHTETLEEYYLEYQLSDGGHLTLKGFIEQQNIQIRLNQLDLNKLPLLTPSFSWTIDAIS